MIDPSQKKIEMVCLTESTSCKTESLKRTRYGVADGQKRIWKFLREGAK